MSMRVETIPWGRTPQGQDVNLHSLSNGRGMSLSVTEYGGTLVKLQVPGPDGHVLDVALGYDKLEAYLADTIFMGSLVGRTANRTSLARAHVQGTDFPLDRNHGKHTLHGGSGGFHTKVWEVDTQCSDTRCTLTLSLASPHLDQGFPGSLKARTTYSLNNKQELAISFEAETDRPTLVDMTSHIYFNLAGHASGSCLDHLAVFEAGNILEQDPEQIPTGALLPTKGTGLDLAQEKPLSLGLASAEPQMRTPGGFDHYYVLDKAPDAPAQAALVTCKASGVAMAMLTDAPGFQFYTGNSIPEGTPGKDGAVYGKHSGFCLEAHGYPDADKHPVFPQALLLPGRIYSRTTLYRFHAI